MGELVRTIAGTQSSSGGYVKRGNSKQFNNDKTDSGAYAGATISSATLRLINFKSYASSFIEVRINGEYVGETVNYFSADSSLHSWESPMENLSNLLLTTTSIDSIELYVRDNHSSSTGNVAFWYIKGDSAGGGGTKVEIVAKTVYGDPTPPTTVALNGTNGDIHVPAGSAVTLSWSGGGDGTLNPFSGYQVYKNGSPFGAVQTGTSKQVDVPSAGSSIYYTVVRKGTYSDSAESARRTIYAYSNPSAPNSVKANGSDAITVDAGSSVTLSWGNGSAGSGNAIAGYQIYRSTSPNGPYSAVGGIVSGTSATVAAPSSMGQTYYYKVVTVGAYSSSGLSDPYAAITAQIYTAVGAPTTVTVNPNVTSAGGQVTLSWAGASGGTNTSVVSYQVYRSSSPNSGYSLLASTTATSIAVTAPSVTGSAYYYKVKSIASKSGYDSDLSGIYAMLAVPADPKAPIIQGAMQGKSYNPRPRVLAQIPTNDIPELPQTISASGWTASRVNQVAGAKVVLRKDVPYGASGSSTITFANQDSYGGVKAVNVVVRYQAPSWTDDPIQAGNTAIKAAHMNELRQAIDDIRVWYGMDAYSWQEEIVAGVTSSVNWARHAQEIKEQIEAIQRFVNEWDATNAALDIALPAISSFYAPQAEVINKLRQAVTML